MRGVGGFVKQVLLVVFVTWAIAAYPLNAYGSTRLAWSLGLLNVSPNLVR